MNERQYLPESPMTRRHAIGIGMAIGAGVVLAPASLRAHFAARPQTADMEQATAFHLPAALASESRSGALVTVDWLTEHLDDPSLVLVGFMPPEDFEAGRIPGSVQVNAPELEVIDTSDDSIGSWHQATQELLGNLGISRDSTVVTYDAGTLFSARLWWILHYFGHAKIHVLDGGLPAWQEAGHDVETGAFEAPAGGDAYEGEPNADLLAQMDEVMGLLEDPDTVILDARTPEEHAEGRIPGAVNLNFPLNADPDAPKFFKSADELQAMYDEIGATADKLVIPYCASGVRSAVTAFVLHLLGYENVALYTGSWLEWGEDPDAPKEAGEDSTARPMKSSPYVLQRHFSGDIPPLQVFSRRVL